MQNNYIISSGLEFNQNLVGYSFFQGAIKKTVDLDSSEVVNQYLQLISSQKDLHTIKEETQVINQFFQYIGKKQFQDINLKDISSYYNFLDKIPKNLEKKFPFVKSLEKIIEITREKQLPKLSPSTKKKKFKTVSRFFEYLVETGQVETNYLKCRIFKFSKKKKDNSFRDEFSRQDLINIFIKGKYFGGSKKDKQFKNIYFWSLLLAPHSGIRLNELAQLHVNDIRKIKRIWCFVISATTDDSLGKENSKKLKNLSSERIVPIHQTLIELGFLNFVEQQKRLGHVRLFPEIKTKKKDSYGAILGEWFSRNKKKYYSIDSTKKTFHSFRHTFANALKQQSVPYEIAAGLLGHSYGGETYGRYGKDYDPKILKEQGIDKIKFNIDWSALKKKCTNQWYLIE